MHYNNLIIPPIVNNVINKRADDIEDDGGFLGGIFRGGEDKGGEIRAISREVADKMMSWLRITNLDTQVTIDTHLYSYAEDLKYYNDELTGVASTSGTP